MNLSCKNSEQRVSRGGEEIVKAHAEGSWNKATILFYISGSYLGMFSLQYSSLHWWLDDLCIISMYGILQLKFLKASL